MTNPYFPIASIVLSNNANVPTAQTPHFCLGQLYTGVRTYRLNHTQKYKETEVEEVAGF